MTKRRKPDRKACSLCKADNVPHRLDGKPMATHLNGRQHCMAEKVRRETVKDMTESDKVAVEVVKALGWFLAGFFVRVPYTPLLMSRKDPEA